MQKPPDHYHRLTTHVIGTLPEDLNARREILESLLFCLPADNEYLAPVRDCLRHLHQHELAQRELNFNLNRKIDSTPNDPSDNNQSS